MREDKYKIEKVYDDVIQSYIYVETKRKELEE
jgi:hypothetical protein